MTMTIEELPSLEALQAQNLSHADHTCLGVTAKNADEEALINVLNAYLSDFAAFKTEDPVKCVRCGRDLSGILGFFEWGIQYGEGRCASCHWPCRGIHRVYDAVSDKKPAIRWAMPLCYHPSVVERGAKS